MWLLAVLLLPGLAVLPAQTTGDFEFALRRSIGTPAPELEYVDPSDSRAHRITELRGKVVLLCFWNRSCGPCADEMPELSRIREEYRDADFEILHVSPDDRETHTRFLASHETSGLFGMIEREGLRPPYQASAFPMHLLIDAGGVVRDGWFGALGYEQTEQKVNALLPGRGTSGTASKVSYFLGALILVGVGIVFAWMYFKNQNALLP